MYYVYILKSLEKSFSYVGHCANLDIRIAQHNKGDVKSTKHYLPLELEMYVGVKTKSKAQQLEQYFKTGSGKAVLKKRFLS